MCANFQIISKFSAIQKKLQGKNLYEFSAIILALSLLLIAGVNFWLAGNIEEGKVTRNKKKFHKSEGNFNSERTWDQVSAAEETVILNGGEDSADEDED